MNASFFIPCRITLMTGVFIYYLNVNKNMSAIIGLKLENRNEEAIKLQAILTVYGCNIQTRIGLHPMGEYKCNNYGIILLEIVSKVNEIYDELSRHWDIQIMRFE